MHSEENHLIREMLDALAAATGLRVGKEAGDDGA